LWKLTFPGGFSGYHRYVFPKVPWDFVFKLLRELYSNYVGSCSRTTRGVCMEVLREFDYNYMGSSI
jgi:hypothetical protein